ncbi:hypothetical protein KKA14_22275, partial [bacterium]|nr:hypothetical protein [bacterium]
TEIWNLSAPPKNISIGAAILRPSRNAPEKSNTKGNYSVPLNSLTSRESFHRQAFRFFIPIQEIKEHETCF